MVHPRLWRGHLILLYGTGTVVLCSPSPACQDLPKTSASAPEFISNLQKTLIRAVKTACDDAYM
eukprot:1922129-Prymnesium_polylepis.1